MEYENYYKIETDGTFSIHFPNYKKLSIDEIKELFSPHGDVVSVNTAGSINGLRFVKFKTVEEISRSLEAFRNSDTIRILPQKKFQNGKNKIDKKFSKQQITSSKDDSFSSLSHTSNQAIKQHNRSHSNGSSSDTCSQGSRHRYRLNTNTIKCNKSNSPLSDSLHIQQNYNNSIAPTLNNDLEVIKRFHIDNYMNKDMLDYKIPALISKSDVRDKEYDSVSNYSLRNATKISSKAIIIPMQEIIVANIHANYGVHYILHLFERYNPISATLIKKIPETGVRYCHVYFRTLQDAIAIEEKFDNFFLSEKNLIVLRKSRLIELATFV